MPAWLIAASSCRTLYGVLASLADLLSSLPPNPTSTYQPATLNPKSTPTADSTFSTASPADSQQAVKAALADLAQRLTATLAAEPATGAPGGPKPQAAPAAMSNTIKKVLEDWADDYLPGLPGPGFSGPAGDVARSMFKQVVDTLLHHRNCQQPPTAGTANTAGGLDSGLGRAVLAAAVAVAAAGGVDAGATVAGAARPLKVTAASVGDGTTGANDIAHIGG